MSRYTRSRPKMGQPPVVDVIRNGRKLGNFYKKPEFDRWVVVVYYPGGRQKTVWSKKLVYTHADFHPPGHHLMGTFNDAGRKKQRLMWEEASAAGERARRCLKYGLDPSVPDEILRDYELDLGLPKEDE